MDDYFINTGVSLSAEFIEHFYTANYKNANVYMAVRTIDQEHHTYQAFSNISFIDTKYSTSLYDTIVKSLGSIKEDWIFINPITTLPSSFNHDFRHLIFAGSDLLVQENWSCIKYTEDGKTILVPKSPPNTTLDLSYPFTGRLLVRRTTLEQALSDCTSASTDLIDLVAKLENQVDFYVHHESWLDLGHVATYSKSKVYKFSSRFFNSLSYAPKNNSIKKPLLMYKS